MRYRLAVPFAFFRSFPTMTAQRMSRVLLRSVLFIGLFIAWSGCDSGGGTDSSDSEGPPAAPRGLAVTAQGQSAVLQWNAPTGTPAADRYNVYRAVDTAPDVTGTPINGDTPVTTTEYTDDTTEPGLLYLYRVTAVSARGEESSPTSAVEIRVFPPPPDRPNP